MGIMNLFRGTKTEQKSANLDDYIVSLDKVAVSLSKETNVDFTNLKSKVKLVLDYSGSMSGRYSNGTMQEVINKLFPFALKFDDDGEMECYLFSDYYKEIKPCKKSNYEDYISRNVMRSSFCMGGTSYAGVLNAIHSKVTNDIPEFIIFITDGDNFDKTETDKIVRAMSTDNCFIMFVGIGRDNFSYLETLDVFDDRPIDNTGFVKFADIEKVNETEMYTKLLTEYSNWLKR